MWYFPTNEPNREARLNFVDLELTLLRVEDQSRIGHSVFASNLLKSLGIFFHICSDSHINKHRARKTLAAATKDVDDDTELLTHTSIWSCDERHASSMGSPSCCWDTSDLTCLNWMFSCRLGLLRVGFSISGVFTFSVTVLFLKKLFFFLSLSIS